MKKLMCLLFALTISNNAMAGLLIESDKNQYMVGEDINISVIYATDDNSPIADSLDVQFNMNTYFEFSDNVATFSSTTLPGSYVDSDPFTTFVQLSNNEAEYYLDTFGFVAPFNATDTQVNLGTIVFNSTDEGKFDFNVIDFGLIDFLGFDAQTSGVSLTVDVVNANASVPEPSTIFMLAGALALLTCRRSSKQ